MPPVTITLSPIHSNIQPFDFLIIELFTVPLWIFRGSQIEILLLLLRPLVEKSVWENDRGKRLDNKDFYLWVLYKCNILVTNETNIAVTFILRNTLSLEVSILSKYNLHTIKYTHFKHVVWWILANVYRQLCNSQAVEHVYCPRNFPCAFTQSVPPPHPAPVSHWSVFIITN